MNHTYTILVVFFLLIGCSSDDSGRESQEETQLSSLKEIAQDYPNEGRWVAKDGMKSRDGSEMGYGAYLNPDSKKLIIFLDGGGACFNGFTCGSNQSNFSEQDFYDRLENENALIVNRNSESNSFKDWNFVFVPYATGDVHLGNNAEADVSKGGPGDQIMVGYQNFSLVLQDLKDYFSGDNALEEIVFMGSSAGGFGVLGNSNQLAQTLSSGVKTTVIVDAGQIFMDNELLTDCLLDEWRTLWNLDASVPDDINLVVTGTYDYDFQKIYEYLAVKYPNINFGFLSYYEDQINRGFYSFGQNNCNYPPTTLLSGQKFKNGLLNLKTEVFDDLSNWKVFYKNGTTHTFLNSASLDQSINGTSLNEWINLLRAGTATDLTE